MSFQPIDLQILFSHLEQGARAHHAQTAAAGQQQAALGEHLAEKSTEAQRNVSSAEETPDLAAAPHEGHGEAGEGFSEHKDRKKGTDAHYKKINDPQLGKHIDVTQ